jgi:hypothetical protein
MNNNRYIVVHKHYYGGGGIGDFIRASMSFYSICKRHNFEYYIDFSVNKFLKKCFNYKKLPKEIKNSNLNTNTIKFFQEQIIFDEKSFLDKVLAFPNGINYLYSNAIGIESKENILNIHKDYISNILSPKKLINDYINNIFQKYNISKNNYISVHVRCGDKHILKNDLNYFTNHEWININDNDVYITFCNTIDKFKKDYNLDLPIIIHSDSNIFKEKIKKINPEFIILDIDVTHISEPLGPQNINSYIQTIAEFFIISKANLIYSPYTYSGFAHLASIIGNKNIYFISHHYYYDLLNFNNIFNIK